MISGHAALMRTLHSFMEKSGLPWNQVNFVRQSNEDGGTILDPHRADVWFPHNNQRVDLYIVATGETDPHSEDRSPLPNGRIAARYQGNVVKGPIDQSTWDNIVKLLRG
jgi:hypothetical protein